MYIRLLCFSVNEIIIIFTNANTLPRRVTSSTADWVLVPPVCGVEEPLKLLSYNPNPRPGSGSLP